MCDHEGKLTCTDDDDVMKKSSKLGRQFIPLFIIGTLDGLCVAAAAVCSINKS